jgi:hypothetical protein
MAHLIRILSNNDVAIENSLQRDKNLLITQKLSKRRREADSGFLVELAVTYTCMLLQNKTTLSIHRGPDILFCLLFITPRDLVIAQIPDIHSSKHVNRSNVSDFRQKNRQAM